MQSVEPFPQCVFRQMPRNLFRQTDGHAAKWGTVGQMDEQTHVQVERGYLGLPTKGQMDRQLDNSKKKMPQVLKDKGITIVQLLYSSCWVLIPQSQPELLACLPEADHTDWWTTKLKRPAVTHQYITSSNITQSKKAGSSDLSRVFSGTICWYNYLQNSDSWKINLELAII